MFTTHSFKKAKKAKGFCTHSLKKAKKAKGFCALFSKKPNTFCALFSKKRLESAKVFDVFLELGTYVEDAGHDLNATGCGQAIDHVVHFFFFDGLFISQGMSSENKTHHGVVLKVNTELAPKFILG